MSAALGAHAFVGTAITIRDRNYKIPYTFLFQLGFEYQLPQKILKGANSTGFLIDLHESDLGPGEMPHPPHHHIHEEMLLISEGQVDITISGKNIARVWRRR